MSDRMLIQLKNFQVLSRGSGLALNSPLNLNILAGTVNLLKGKNGIGKSSLVQALVSKNRNSSAIFRGTYHRTADLDFVVHPQISAPMFALPLRLADILAWSDSLSEAGLLILGDVDLERSWDSCSGGERQRILLASIFNERFFSNKKPTLLILDEPMNHLDFQSQRNLVEAIKIWMSQWHERSVLIVSHEDLKGLESHIHVLSDVDQE
jgi:ABC-type molybdenum transport system ATPase subunit/photorepair protein PhrA